MVDAGATFLKLACTLDYPLFIVAAAHGEHREGCVIGFATQASVHPPRFLACLSRENATYRLACEVDALAVHLVPRERVQLAELFGGETGDEVDKFARCAWQPGPRGLPILDGCTSWFAGAIRARHDLGDHVGFLLEPIAARHDDEAASGVVMFQSVKTAITPGHPIP